MGKRHSGQFKKGQSGNPGGRPKTPENIKELKKVSYTVFVETMHRYGEMSKEQLKAEMTRPDTTMWELMFGNMVATAANGDRDIRREIMKRLWGEPIPEPVKIGNGDNEEHTDDVIDLQPVVRLTLPDNGRSNKDTD